MRRRIDEQVRQRTFSKFILSRIIQYVQVLYMHWALEFLYRYSVHPHALSLRSSYLQQQTFAAMGNGEIWKSRCRLTFNDLISKVSGAGSGPSLPPLATSPAPTEKYPPVWWHLLDESNGSLQALCGPFSPLDSGALTSSIPKPTAAAPVREWLQRPHPESLRVSMCLPRFLR